MAPEDTPACLRCGAALESLGEKHIQTMGILERYIEVLMLRCPTCGHVEFFADPPFADKNPSHGARPGKG